MKATYQKYVLQFKKPSGTSRGVLYNKETYFLKIENNLKKGIGECALFKGLSADDVPKYEQKLQWLCEHINMAKEDLLQALNEFPSIQFGLEQALLSLDAENPFIIFPSLFTKSKKAIPINGLVWMGDKRFMNSQIKDKIEAGFSVIKMKIGAIDFKTEIELLKSIRNEYTPSEIEIRVDANGAFNTDNALEKLKELSDLSIHSIEQPIKPKQFEEMANLCRISPIPIALDEELIGVFSVTDREKLLQTIKPNYIILKPSLIGGYAGTDEWIKLAKKENVGWWITSALESNIGLNAIAQYTAKLNTSMPQGLGTGSLFTNNIASPLEVKNGGLHYNVKLKWDEKIL